MRAARPPMFACAFLALASVVACGSTGGKPAAPVLSDAGDTDAGSPDSGEADLCLGAAAAAFPMDDGGMTTDGGTPIIDCARLGQTTLVWRLEGSTGPSLQQYHAFFAVGSDGLDGIRISTVSSSDVVQDIRDDTYGPDGHLRACMISRQIVSRNPRDPEPPSLLSSAHGGRVVQNDGRVRSAVDGRVYYRFPPSNGDCCWVQTDTNGSLAAFVVNASSSSTVEVLDASGSLLWERVVDDNSLRVSLDDSGNTLLDLQTSGTALGVGIDGGTLYSIQSSSQCCTYGIGGGLFVKNASTLFRTSDGALVATTPFSYPDYFVAAGARVIVETSQGISSFDPVNETIIWNKAEDAFSVAGELVLLIDSQHLLHVVRPDGTDAIACTLAPGVGALLLPGGRLVLQRFPNLEVYDLEIYDAPRASGVRGPSQ